MDRSNCCLIAAHPGHELRIHGWLKSAKPKVFVLTDGSGNSGESRLSSTTNILKQIGCELGAVFGVFSDKEIYSLIINQEFARFIPIAESIAAVLSDDTMDYVVGDAVEGYNPSHDICRLLINAAVEVADKRRIVPIKNYDVLLVGLPNSCSPELQDQAVWVHLDEKAFEAKLTAAYSYPELLGEVQEALKVFGKDAFKVECLRPVKLPQQYGILEKVPPNYEQHGESRVAQGIYTNVLRYREHMLPFMEALKLWVENTR